MKRTQHRANSGFTIVELVVVIVIIGILAAVALPRFIDLTGDAHSAAVNGTGGAFSAAVNIVHAGWMAAGGTASVNQVTLEGSTTIEVSDTGWPEATGAAANGTQTAAECVEVWNGVLSNPPSAATAAGSDYLASVTTSPTCIFTLEATSGRTITFNSATGAVVITTP